MFPWCLTSPLFVQIYTYKGLSLSQLITVSRLLLGSTIVVVQSSIYFPTRSVLRNSFRHGDHKKSSQGRMRTFVELSPIFLEHVRIFLYWRSQGPYTRSSVLTPSESILSRRFLPRTEVIRSLNPFHLRTSVLFGISTLHR